MPRHLYQSLCESFYSYIFLNLSLRRVVNAGPKPKVKEDDFGDLLSTQGFSSKFDKKGPRTIAEMRRQEVTKDMDPLKLQVTN